MKLVKHNDRIQIRIDHDLKIKAEKVLAEKYRKSISQYLREKLEEVINNEEHRL